MSKYVESGRTAFVTKGFITRVILSIFLVVALTPTPAFAQTAEAPDEGVSVAAGTVVPEEDATAVAPGEDVSAVASGEVGEEESADSEDIVKEETADSEEAPNENPDGEALDGTESPDDKTPDRKATEDDESGIVEKSDKSDKPKASPQVRSSVVPLSNVSLLSTVESGTAGENVTWTLEDDTLTISGTGEMEDYENPAA